jgi:hypothetical protein
VQPYPEEDHYDIIQIFAQKLSFIILYKHISISINININMSTSMRLDQIRSCNKFTIYTYMYMHTMFTK